MFIGIHTIQMSIIQIGTGYFVYTKSYKYNPNFHVTFHGEPLILVRLICSVTSLIGPISSSLNMEELENCPFIACVQLR